MDSSLLQRFVELSANSYPAVDKEALRKISCIKEVLSLILFGSTARGDQDAESDTDYCALVVDSDFRRIVSIRKDLSGILEEPIESVTIYSASAINRMAERGSLFMEHLKQEGKILYDPDGFAGGVFRRLRPFDDYCREIELYEGLLRDTMRSLESLGYLTHFDLHMLHGIVRDACILLTYYAGRVAFGRTSAFEVARAIFPGLPVNQRDFDLLCSAHLTYKRRGRCEEPLPDRNMAMLLISRTRNLLRFCEEAVS